ncbi:SHOCT domain-containing protein [Beggiatoa leptomitoformis]|uniref:SHOCT domain-containing protein n=1 Tax=Beggiatoa leptomitoformis TaxID=288004 RepID=A0A2N9YGT3_9GAMM|nr:SHOCT domain-containing protein [Beggiatoa leptomitoformis]ALG68108.1 hypothetical protein AL038_10815 [Beggiatoa leptomitoformis]AUI69595.1 hypothetical protein BLE401_13455 [Beggiatoa leptomitoformis]
MQVFKRSITTIALFSLLFSTITATAFTLFNQDDTYLWRFKDEQYVRLETNEGASANQHPVNFTTEQLRQILASLKVERDNVTIPIFEEKELAILNPAITTGLSRANPMQDVTFAVIGMHTGLITNENRVTTGRVFYQEGQLHLIFGLLHGEIDYTQDRRLYPFLAGSRQHAPTHAWRIVPQTGLNIAANASHTVAIDVNGFIKNIQQQALNRAMPEKLATETQKVSVETARLTEEVSQLKEEVQTLKQQPSGKKPVSVEPEAHQLKQAVSQLQQEVKTLKQTPVTPVTTSSNLSATQIETRLQTLKTLREKNLITEAEYQQKRKQILDAL